MKSSKLWNLCGNWKVIGGIVLLAVGLYFFAPPSVASFAPFLLFLLCPLSMLLMMGSMKSNETADVLYTCPECGFTYAESAWAEKCAAWCKEHKSCNIEITKHAVKRG